MPRSKQTRLVSLTSLLCGILLLSFGSGCCMTPVCLTGGGGMCSTCGDGMAGGCDSCDSGGCEGGGQFPASCGTCSTGNCGGLSGLVLPLLSTRLACGSGCGGVYWNEWVSDPPVCCDPCDDCGCWVGARCGDCAGSSCESAIRRGPLGIVGAAVHGVGNAVSNVVHTGLYGYRSTSCGCAECAGTITSDCDAGGCDSCGVSGCDGSCAQSTAVPMPDVAQHNASTPIRQVAAQGRVMTQVQQRPPHRVVTQRLRR